MAVTGYAEYAGRIALAVGAGARSVTDGVERVASPSVVGEEMNATGALHGELIVLMHAWLCGTLCIHWASMIALQTASSTTLVELHNLGRASHFWYASVCAQCACMIRALAPVHFGL